MNTRQPLRVAARCGVIALLAAATAGFAQGTTDGASRPIGSGFGDGTSSGNLNNSGISTPSSSSSSTAPSQWVTPGGVVIIEGGRRQMGETRLPAQNGSVQTPTGTFDGGVPTGALGGGVPGAAGRTGAPVRSGGSVIAQ